MQTETFFGKENSKIYTDNHKWIILWQNSTFSMPVNMCKFVYLAFFPDMIEMCYF